MTQENKELLLKDLCGRLPKFKVGDKIKDRNNRVWFVVQVSDKYFDISSVPNAEGYFVPIEDQDEYELVSVVLKFKVGDKIKKKKDYISGVITDISDGTYRVEYKSGGVAFANIEFQEDWELVRDKSLKMEFESQICTSIEESKRLLALGLKKETADMVYIPYYRNYTLHSYFEPKVLDDDTLHYMLTDQSFADYIPAWSLHRLLELVGFPTFGLGQVISKDYDYIISGIEHHIKEGLFNKDYLEEK